MAMNQPSAVSVEDLFTVEGDVEAIEVAEDFFGFALFEGEAPDGADGAARLKLEARPKGAPSR